jgi:3-oxoacid CoA-transferase
MDLIAGKQTLIVMMEHRDSKDRPKLRSQCTYPLTGKQCVDIVVTDLAILRRDGDTWKIEEVADGFTPEEVVALSELEVAGVPTPA